MTSYTTPSAPLHLALPTQRRSETPQATGAVSWTEGIAPSIHFFGAPPDRTTSTRSHPR